VGWLDAERGEGGEGDGGAADVSGDERSFPAVSPDGGGGD
jgi:hypothetical protein